MQEDLLLGDLRAFATRALLASHDVLCPYTAPLNASGVLMLYRNAPKVAPRHHPPAVRAFHQLTS